MPSAGMEIRAWYCQGTRSATYDDICADDGDEDNADGEDNNLGDESGRELGGGIIDDNAGDDDDSEGDSGDSDEQDNLMEWTCDDDKIFCHLLADQEMTYLQARRFCNRQGIDYTKRLH